MDLRNEIENETIENFIAQLSRICARAFSIAGFVKRCKAAYHIDFRQIRRRVEAPRAS
jgi:hypothetical protein